MISQAVEKTWIGMGGYRRLRGEWVKLDKQTWQQKKQWYTEDDFSKATP